MMSDGRLVEDLYEKLRCPKCGKTGMATQSGSLLLSLHRAIAVWVKLSLAQLRSVVLVIQLPAISAMPPCCESLATCRTI
jgi:hypothetical protein